MQSVAGESGGGGEGPLLFPVSPADVLQKMMHDGIFDSLKAQILSELKHDEDLKGYAKSLVKGSQTLANSNARSWARNKRELFESLRKELEAPILEKASRTTWNIILSPDGAGGEIVNQVDSVFSALASESTKAASKPHAKAAEASEDAARDSSATAGPSQKGKTPAKPKLGDRSRTGDAGGDRKKLPRVPSQEGKAGVPGRPAKKGSGAKGPVGSTKATQDGQVVQPGKSPSLGKPGLAPASSKPKMHSSGPVKQVGTAAQRSSTATAKKGPSDDDLVKREPAAQTPARLSSGRELKNVPEEKAVKDQVAAEPHANKATTSQPVLAGAQVQEGGRRFQSIVEATNVLREAGIPAPLLDLPPLPGPRWVGDTQNLRILATALNIQPDYSALVQRPPSTTRRLDGDPIIPETQQAKQEASSSERGTAEGQKPAAGVLKMLVLGPGPVLQVEGEAKGGQEGQQPEPRKRSRAGGWDVLPPGMSLQGSSGPGVEDKGSQQGSAWDALPAFKRQAVSFTTQPPTATRAWYDQLGADLTYGMGARYGIPAGYRQYPGYAHAAIGMEGWRGEASVDGASTERKQRPRSSNWDKGPDALQTLHGPGEALARCGSRGSGDLTESPSLPEGAQGRPLTFRSDEKRGEKDPGLSFWRASGSSPKAGQTSRPLATFRSPRDGEQERDRDVGGRQRERTLVRESGKGPSEDASPREKPRSAREDGEAKEKTALSGGQKS